MNTSDAQVNPNKLFVGNLPYSVNEQQLEELFAEYGELKEVKVIIDRMSGRSKGIAFVEYNNEADAQAAIEALNGKEIDGRALAVNVARPFQPRERTGGYNDRRGGGSSGGYGGGGYGGDRRGGNGGGRSDRRSY
jgi:cold-inducible RNA-binding protein